MITGLVLMTGALVKAQEAGEFVVPLSDPAKRGKLKVHLNSGSISIKGTARKDILVQYSSSDRKEKEQNKNKAGKEGLTLISSGTLDLEVSEHENAVTVRSESWNTKLDVQLEIPLGFDLWAHTYNNGDIQVTNIQGIVEMTNYNGKIRGEGISGSAVATTYNGEIVVRFDKVTEGTPMSFSTYNGNIDLTFPATWKASLKMKTERGEIYSGFEMNVTKSDPVQQKDTKSGTYKVLIDDWVKGDVNGGGAEFTIKNYNGDIYIRKK